MSIFCKHEWKVLSETTTKSRAEQVEDLGGMIKGCADSILSRKFIQIVTCDKCCKLKRFVEEI